MDTSSFDAKIAAHRSDLHSKDGELELVTRTFITYLVEFLDAWIDQDAKDVIAANAGQAKALGPDGLNGLRGGIENFKSELKSSVEDEFLQEKYWVHRDASVPQGTIADEPHVMPSGSHLGVPHRFEEGIGVVLKNLFSLYAYYGITKTTERRSLTEWSEKLAKLFEQYSQLLAYRTKTLADLREAESAKEKAEALDLWNKTSP
jgi:hypothetical protein